MDVNNVFFGDYIKMNIALDPQYCRAEVRVRLRRVMVNSVSVCFPYRCQNNMPPKFVRNFQASAGVEAEKVKIP